MKKLNKNELMQELNNMSQSELINYNNAIMFDNDLPDGIVHDGLTDFIYEYGDCYDIIDLVNMVHFGKIIYSDDIIKINGYGNLESMTFSELVDELADFIIEISTN